MWTYTHTFTYTVILHHASIPSPRFFSRNSLSGGEQKETLIATDDFAKLYNRVDLLCYLLHDHILITYTTHTTHNTHTSTNIDTYTQGRSQDF